jgi:hypothetical protein
MRKAIIIFSLLLAACSPRFRIQSDTPFPGSFEQYKTFKFYNPENIPASNFSFDAQSKKIIFDAVADEFKARGYSSIQDADLLVKIQGGTKSSVEVRADNNFFPYDPYYNMYSYNRFYDDYYSQRRNESKKDSHIIIDVIDIKTDRIVWQGVGIGSFGKREAIDELKLREAISAIFTQYPE